MTEPSPPLIDLSTEGAIGGWEWAVLGVVAAAALFYLLRKYFVRKSGCAGCGKVGLCALAHPAPNQAVSGKACRTSQAEHAREPEEL